MPQPSKAHSALDLEAPIRHVLIVGAGTMGYEIAAQCAWHEVTAVLHDVQPKALEDVRGRLTAILRERGRFELVFAGQLEAVLARVTVSSDPVNSARGAQLLIEAVPEDRRLKREVLAAFHPLCDPSCIFATTSSYVLPSSLAHASGRATQLAALHFHAPVWYANLVDVMPHKLTSPAVVDRLVQFARSIGQVPIVFKKESPGYAFNYLFQTLLMSSLTLWDREVASWEDIDRSWMIVTKMPIGPFGMIDLVGVATVRQIVAQWAKFTNYAHHDRLVGRLQQMLDEGRQGKKSGQGFYEYPHPAFARAEFHAGSMPGRPMPPTQRKRRYVFALEPSGIHASLRSSVERMLALSSASPTSALIVGHNATADRLVERLKASGIEVLRLHHAAAGHDEVDRLLHRGPRHLFLLASCDAPLASSTADGPSLADLVEKHQYLVTQRWFASLVANRSLRDCTCMGVSCLGGAYGMRAPAGVNGAGLAGLLRAMFIEAAAESPIGLRVRNIDLPHNEDADIAADRLFDDWLLVRQSLANSSQADLRRHAADMEVGWSQGKRHVLRLRPAPAAAQPRRDALPSRGASWLVTGGGRGITAVMAEALAQRYGVHLHLCGRTALPEVDFTLWTREQIDEHRQQVMRRAFSAGQKPNVAWERVQAVMEIQATLKRMADSGIEAQYHACDVTDRIQLAKLLGEIRQRGPLEGIIHGAGVEITRRFDRKSEAELQATLAPKLLGARCLAELAAGTELRYFIGFGSLSARFGGMGQTDYAFANDALAKVISRFADLHPQTRCLTIHWPGWADVGMAARSASVFMLAKAGHELMSIDEGIEHFLSEIEIDDTAREVVIVGVEEVPSAFVVHDRDLQAAASWEARWPQ